MCSLERTQDSDPNPAIVSQIPTAEKSEPLVLPGVAVDRSRPKSPRVVWGQSCRESAGVGLRNKGLQQILDYSGRLRGLAKTPTDSRQLQMTPVDSRQFRMSPDNAGWIYLPESDRSRLRIFTNYTHHKSRSSTQKMLIQKNSTTRWRQ